MTPSPDGNSPKEKKVETRRYPTRYERLVPVALFFVGVLMLALLVVTLAVLAGS
jgi:hypothetical protein